MCLCVWMWLVLVTIMRDLERSETDRRQGPEEKLLLSARVIVRPGPVLANKRPELRGCDQ